MNVLITGATGTVGSALTRNLIDHGHHVVAVSRDATAARLSLPADVDVQGWDAASPLPPEVLAGIDAIVHLAGAGVADSRWTAKRKLEIETSRVNSAEQLVDSIAALPANQRPRIFLSASAIGLYGDRGDQQLSEDSGPGTGYLAHVCRAWETAVGRAEDQGCRVAIARIGVVLSPEGGMLEQVLPIFRLGLGGRLGSGQQWLSWIHLDDLVAMLARALDDDKVVGPFNAVAPTPVRNRDFTATLATLVRRPALFPAPEFALRLALGEMADMLLASQHVAPEKMLARQFEFQYPTLESALRPLTANVEHVRVYEQRVPKPLAELFPFYADASNLEKLTPDFVRFKMLSAPEGQIEQGSELSYRIILHGLPVYWRTLIDAWEPNSHFVDTQIRGPYKQWIHRHEFVDEGDHTLVRDIVRYRLPLGALGDWVAGAWVSRDIRRIFHYRRDALEQLFPGASPAQTGPAV